MLDEKHKKSHQSNMHYTGMSQSVLFFFFFANHHNHLVFEWRFSASYYEKNEIPHLPSLPIESKFCASSDSCFPDNCGPHKFLLCLLNNIFSGPLQEITAASC